MPLNRKADTTYKLQKTSIGISHPSSAFSNPLARRTTTRFHQIRRRISRPFSGMDVIPTSFDLLLTTFIENWMSSLPNGKRKCLAALSSVFLTRAKGMMKYAHLKGVSSVLWLTFMFVWN